MGFISSLQDTLQLLKNTFVIIKENTEIFKPTKRLIIIYLSFYFALIFSLFAAIIISGPARWVLLLLALISIIILVPLAPYIRIYYCAAQSWIVYNTFIGKKASYKDGILRAKQNKKDIFILGTFDIILTILAKRLKMGSGRRGFFGSLLNGLMWLIGKTIEEGWDLIGHYLLPASIINDKSVVEVLPDIPKIKNNVPGALAGIFGIDFVGDLFIGYVNIFFAITLFVLFVLGMIMPALLILFLLALIIIVGINIILKTLVAMVKTIYFTLFYISVVMPMKIDKKYKTEVTHYLLFSSEKESEDAEDVKKLIPYVRQYRGQGYTDAQIKKFLIEKGWSNKTINDVLKH